MISARLARSFPKSARLRKRRDFRFEKYQKWQTENFLFVYSSVGTGRVGISISKKVLRRAVERNRIRRLIREAFRHRRQEMMKRDIHIIARTNLERNWEGLKTVDLDREFGKFLKSTH